MPKNPISIEIKQKCVEMAAEGMTSGQIYKEYFSKVHLGHLHHEKEGDVYGVMIRRLSTQAMTDEWSDDNGFIGAHKRFMVFEYEPGKLKTIHYI